MNISGLHSAIQGEVYEDEATRESASHDASIFRLMPCAIVAPKNVDDVGELVKFINKENTEGNKLSLTARAAGTDMTGGPLTESIVVDFGKYFTRIKEVSATRAVVEPGVYYRDFEKETLKHNALMPSYPASRELCMVGGMVANNAGGEKTLAYGKTADYVIALKVVLADGKEYAIEPLTHTELGQKMAEESFEGECYRKLFALIEKKYDQIQKARPTVSKNSSGYNLWDIWDKKRFDLTKLFVGSQGTLGLITEITFKLVSQKPYEGMCVVFLDDFAQIPKLVETIMTFRPVSVESFDHQTFGLALRFLGGFVRALGAKNVWALFKRFLPEMRMIALHGIPRLVTLVEFEEMTQEEVEKKVKALQEALKQLPVRTRAALTKEEREKYWIIRHESFNLLRHKIKNKQTVPCIEDLIVRPEYLPEFLPKLYALLEKYKIHPTIAGHLGEGNFHIIPLMDLKNIGEREIIVPLMDEVYELVFSYHGSMSAEHNDGMLRTPYLEEMYGKEIYALFEEVKTIFDPLNIFNPGKKVGGDKSAFFTHLFVKE